MMNMQAKPTVSPDELLKAIVAGKADPKPAPEPAAHAAAVAARPAGSRFAIPSLATIDARRFAIPGAALAIGLVLGAGFTARSGSGGVSGDAVVALSATVDAGRTETARLGADIAQLHQVLADLRAATDTARKEAGTRSSALSERLTQIDKNLNTKTAALGERLEQGEREQSGRIAGLAAQLERRAAIAAPLAKPEPTQTGSLGDAKAVDGKAAEVKVADAKAADPKPKSASADKPAVIDGWAVRDVYDGAAILENRRRRIVEVAPGDTVPGVGRVEGVERRGREWVVVTRQGLVTSQPW